MACYKNNTRLSLNIHVSFIALFLILDTAYAAVGENKITAPPPHGAKAVDGQTPDSKDLKDYAALKDYLDHELMLIDRGVVFRLRVDHLSTSEVPITIPAKILGEMHSVRYIYGTICNKSCNIVLGDGQGRTMTTLSTRKACLFGMIWERPTLTDDEFSDGLCGYFPLCFNGEELRLWPMDVVLACISPASLNSSRHYYFAERSGMAIQLSCPNRKEFLFNVKVAQGHEDTLALDYTDDLPVCSAVTTGAVSGGACPDGRYPALARYGLHSGNKIPLCPGFGLYDHVRAQLFNGIEFSATVLEARPL